MRTANPYVKAIVYEFVLDNYEYLIDLINDSSLQGYKWETHNKIATEISNATGIASFDILPELERLDLESLGFSESRLK